MVPANSSRVSRAPPYLGAAKRLYRVFAYAAVTLFGRPFQTVQLTQYSPSFHPLKPPSQEPPVHDCGPVTPGSPCESPGLDSSAFARHYSRNHGCFLLLGVLRWFTSPGSLRNPMDSDY